MLGSTAALIVVAAPVPDSDQRIRGPCAVTKCLAGISLALVGSETSVGGGGVAWKSNMVPPSGAMAGMWWRHHIPCGKVFLGWGAVQKALAKAFQGGHSL